MAENVPWFRQEDLFQIYIPDGEREKQSNSPLSTCETITPGGRQRRNCFINPSFFKSWSTFAQISFSGHHNKISFGGHLLLKFQAGMNFWWSSYPQISDMDLFFSQISRSLLFGKSNLNYDAQGQFLLGSR